MTHGPMRLPVAELIDRLTIELRKSYYGHGNDALIDEVRQELFGRILNILRGPNPEIAVMAMVCGAGLLGIRNADIAACEWQIRFGRDLSLEDLGQRAVITRKINDSRSEIKQELSKALMENVETRHYGFDGVLDPDKMKLEVQEPAGKIQQNV